MSRMMDVLSFGVVAHLQPVVGLDLLDLPTSPVENSETPQPKQPIMESARLYGNINKYGYYFTDLWVGSPEPQRTSVIVDTGSRVAGFPCRGCEHCGVHIDPAFDADKSTSKRWLECGVDCSEGCVDGQCSYKEVYSEGSSVMGKYFYDQVTLDHISSNNSSAPVWAQLGCHNSEDKLFYTQRANGIMGLAPSDDNPDVYNAPTVLQNLFQDKEHVSKQVFSLCLTTWGGQLTVGGFSTWHHEESIQWTPMHPSKYYRVFPEAISLGSSRDSDGFGNISITEDSGDFGVAIVDSGTTYTYLPNLLFNKFVQSLKAYCDQHDSCNAIREGSECWRLRDASLGPDFFPIASMRFRGGATVAWSPYTYLHERGEPGVWCQTFLGNSLSQTVFGISWMLHKDVIFDLTTNRMGVARAGCPEYHRELEFEQKFERNPAEARKRHVDARALPETAALPTTSHLFVGQIALGASLLAIMAAAVFRARRLPSLTTMGDELLSIAE